MGFSIKEVEKKHGRYPGKRWMVIEEGTANSAIHTSLLMAETTVRFLESGKARFCDCGIFVVGVPGRVHRHICPNTGEYSYE